MILVSKAADSFCDSDLVEKIIRSNNAWSLLPTEAMFASVIPGEYMEGFLSGQIQFPSWLGKNSKRNKIDRILQELQIHTRLSAGLSKSAFNQDFSQYLKSAIIDPMVGSDGGERIEKSVKIMSEYSLLREDLDNLLEVTTWEGSTDPMKSVDSKVKAAFTRTYNKEVILPYATNIGAIAKKSKVSIQDEGLEDYQLEGSDDNKDENDIESDTMIKAKNVKKGKDSNKLETKEIKGKGKGSTGRGRGKGKASK